jgi:6-phosphogluconolactonase (cycloisomerase 2 family)
MNAKPLPTFHVRLSEVAMNTTTKTAMSCLLLITTAGSMSACAPGSDVPSEPFASQSSALTAATGAAFTISNEAAGNRVFAFVRGNDGALSPAGSVATGGAGTGAGLGSQSALALSRNGRWLVAVNAGSNDLSTFEVNGAELRLVSVVPSGGMRPTSVAIHDRLVYALNAGGTANVSGFRISAAGTLEPIAGSSRALSAPSPNAAQVGIAPNGSSVVVTERGTNLIDSFAVDDNGLLGELHTHPSSGTNPFGFDFTPTNHIVVSEVRGGPGAAAASSYDIDPSAALTTVTASLANSQTAACWAIVTPNGRYAYTANTPSATISGYRVEASGALSLLDSSGITASPGAGSRPFDMATDRDGRRLYALTPGAGAITAYTIDADGSLTPLATVAGVPSTAAGLAVQ